MSIKSHAFITHWKNVLWAWFLKLLISRMWHSGENLWNLKPSSGKWENVVEEQALGTTGMRCHNNLFCKGPPTRLCQWAFLGVSKCCKDPPPLPYQKKNSASSATNVIGHTSPLFVWTRACWVRPWSECSFVCGRLSEGSQSLLGF